MLKFRQYNFRGEFMLGLGIWEVPVNSMFYKGTAKITVRDDGGKYGFDFEATGMNVPEIDVLSARAEGQTLYAEATSPMLKGKTLNAEITFSGNECTGVVKGPFGVKININGKRIG